MNTNKNTLIKVAGVAILALVIYLLWVFFMKSAAVVSTDQGGGTVCTMDAKQCPDGSWVGRSGPNCQFVCPIPVATSTPKGAVTAEAKLNVKVTPIAEHITVLSVLEDSRCPIDVQCIQAGTVRVRAKIETGMGASQMDLTLNKPVTTETEEITLIAVRPEKESKKQLTENDYTFIFRVVKR
jgi:hypothetical protein